MEITEQVVRDVRDVVRRGLCKGVGNPTLGEMCVEAAVCYALGEPHRDRPICVSPALHRIAMGLNDARWSSNEARAAGLCRLAIAQLGTAGTLDERLFAESLTKAVISKLLPKVLRSVAAVQPEPHKSKLLEAANRCETEWTAAAAYAAAFAADAAAAAMADALAYADAVTFGDAYAAARAAYAAAYAAAFAADAAADEVACTADALAYADAVTFGDAYAAARAAYAAAFAAARAADEVADAAARAADQLLSDFAEEVVQILVEMKTPGSDFLYLTQEV